MRVLLSHVYAWPEVRRGGERYLHELGAALVEAGHEVRIVSTAPEPGRHEVLGVPVQLLPRRRWLADRFGDLAPEVCFGLESLVRHAVGRYDVWHAFGTADAAAAAVLSTARRLPRIRSVYTDLGAPGRTYRVARRDRRLFELVVRRVDAYLCLSEAVRTVLESDWGRRGLVVGGGVDLDRFAPAPARAAAPTLLFSGTAAEPRKNLPLLLDALDLLLAERPDVRLLLSGPGDQEAVLSQASARARAATAALGVGAVGDIERLYGEAWATVLPSVREAFGLVLIESLACGTPIVALAGGGGPAEIVVPAVGALADAATPEALAAACATALDLAAQPSIAETCRAEAARYGWREALVPRLEAVYRGELNG